MKANLPRLAIAAATIAVTALVSAPRNTEAALDKRLLCLSNDLEELACELKGEFRAHYLHTRLFHHMNTDADRLRVEAAHIKRLAHSPYAGIGHISANLADINRLSQHMHQLVGLAETGRLGHVHGCTKHLHSLLGTLSGTVNSMDAHVASLSHPTPHYGYNSRHSNFSNNHNPSYNDGHNLHTAAPVHNGHGHSNHAPEPVYDRGHDDHGHSGHAHSTNRYDQHDRHATRVHPGTPVAVSHPAAAPAPSCGPSGNTSWINSFSSGRLIFGNGRFSLTVR